MSVLENFRDKEFLEQITILNSISLEKETAELSSLLDLFNSPVGDTSVDYMVVTALNGVLSSDEDTILKLLESDNPKLRTLCIRLCGEHKIEPAAQMLVKMADSDLDNEDLFEVLTSLSRIGGDAGLEHYRKYIDHEDSLITGLCIGMIEELEDAESIAKLKQIILKNNDDEHYHVCELSSWKAVEALAAIGNEESLTFIAENIHHRNPTLRRIVTDSLVRKGQVAVPYVAKIISPKSEKDDLILGSNILGFIGHKDGLDALMDGLENNVSDDPSVKYAMYEAIGNIGSLKGVVKLLDGLDESDELIILAVLTALDANANTGVYNRLTEIVEQGGSKAGKLLRAIVTAKAVNLFEGLYGQGKLGNFLMNAIVASKDPHVHSAFRAKLQQMDGENLQRDLARVPEVLEQNDLRALAVDDSKSMVALYRSILTSEGFDPKTALNGQEALDRIAQEDVFDIIITDMNMPVMDGMEFVSKLRDHEQYKATPVIMVTTESEFSQIELARKIGVDDFITKPFSPEKLKNKIKDLLSK